MLYDIPFCPRATLRAHLSPSHRGESPPPNFAGIWLSSRLNNDDWNVIIKPVALHERLAHAWPVILHVWVASSYVQHSLEGHGFPAAAVVELVVAGSTHPHSLQSPPVNPPRPYASRSSSPSSQYEWYCSHETPPRSFQPSGAHFPAINKKTL